MAVLGNWDHSMGSYYRSPFKQILPTVLKKSSFKAFRFCSLTLGAWRVWSRIRFSALCMPQLSALLCSEVLPAGS